MYIAELEDEWRKGKPVTLLKLRPPVSFWPKDSRKLNLQISMKYGCLRPSNQWVVATQNVANLSKSWSMCTAFKSAVNIFLFYLLSCHEGPLQVSLSSSSALQLQELFWKVQCRAWGAQESGTVSEREIVAQLFWTAWKFKSQICKPLSLI